jgi:phenylalanyl-tRNA synthetase alpha chain
LDQTHLAEFHQIEGLVADYNITLANLIGIITEFFKRLGAVLAISSSFFLMFCFALF